MTTDHDALLRPGEAAQLLKISTDTLIRWGNLGRITYTHPHRWSRERRYSQVEVQRVLTSMAEETSDER